MLQWQFHELEDNDEQSEYHYFISIQTALRPFSGTQAAPQCVLEGDQADSKVRCIRSMAGPKVGLGTGLIVKHCITFIWYYGKTPKGGSAV